MLTLAIICTVLLVMGLPSSFIRAAKEDVDGAHFIGSCIGILLRFATFIVTIWILYAN